MSFKIGTCVIARSGYYRPDLFGRRGVVIKDDGGDGRGIHVYVFPRTRARYQGTFSFTRDELTPTRCRSVEARHVYTNIVKSRYASQKSRDLFAVVHDGMLENLTRTPRRKSR